MVSVDINYIVMISFSEPYMCRYVKVLNTHTHTHTHTHTSGYMGFNPVSWTLKYCHYYKTTLLHVDMHDMK